jgi:hypothetical protein
MAGEWYYKFMGDVLGPMTANELRACASDGRIQGETWIRKGENGQWVRAQQVKGLTINQVVNQVPPAILGQTPSTPERTKNFEELDVLPVGARYWLRQKAGKTFDGPYTVPELRKLAANGSIKSDSEVLEATGQTLSQLKNSVAHWKPLTNSSLGTENSQANNQGVLFEFTGVQDTLHVYKDRLSITPQGVMGFLNKGLKGTKDIPFRVIVAIQMKEASAFFNGFLQFTISGGVESTRGLLAATRDENTVMFNAKNNALARQIKGFIQWEIDRLHARPQPVANVSSISEELARLADLRAQGVLSDDEFNTLKKRLLSNP